MAYRFGSLGMAGRAFARTLSGETAAVISLAAVAPAHPLAEKLAFQTVMRRKGRVVDEASSVVARAKDNQLYPTK